MTTNRYFCFLRTNDITFNLLLKQSDASAAERIIINIRKSLTVLKDSKQVDFVPTSKRNAENLQVHCYRQKITCSRNLLSSPKRFMNSDQS